MTLLTILHPGNVRQEYLMFGKEQATTWAGVKVIYETNDEQESSEGAS